MQIKIFLTTVSLAIAAVTAISGCSKDEKDDKQKGLASFKVQLKNSASSLTVAATSLTAKLGGVDLVADCAGDQPPGNCLDIGRSPDPDIWINAGCNNDMAQCTTSNTEFFELIDPAAANTVLNSQGRSIEAGVFTKVRIYMLNNDEGNALQCDGVGSSIRPVMPITVTLPSAVTVAEGESVTVTLNYNPSAVNCADATTISSVLSAMTATVTKN
jgi:hypothetical protein